jgi:dipeptidase
MCIYFILLTHYLPADGMADKSTIATHNNDCTECDTRVNHVPAADWPKGSQRPVFSDRQAYPFYAEEEAYNIHGPAYLVSNVDSSIYNWPARPPIHYIDQVEHTFGYTMGTYGIQNERQLGMGESTCTAIFVSFPVYSGGKAYMNIRQMSEIAMERCETARCAIALMGDLAETHGYYGGSEVNDTLAGQQEESGEHLTVTDAKETWMFHVLPDSTGTAAIWVAQRVPDHHISVVANQFIVTAVNLNDTQNFMGSTNMYAEAIKNHLWDPSSGVAFNFAKVIFYSILITLFILVILPVFHDTSLHARILITIYIYIYIYISCRFTVVITAASGAGTCALAACGGSSPSPPRPSSCLRTPTALPHTGTAPMAPSLTLSAWSRIRS